MARRLGRSSSKGRLRAVNKMSDRDLHLRALISTKGVLRNGNRVLLVKNARSEWELPGGKLEAGENPEKCLGREIQEELGLTIVRPRILGAFNHHYYDDVVVIAYDCGELHDVAFSLSVEHSDGGWFELAQVLTMNVPENYKRVIRICYEGDQPDADA